VILRASLRRYDTTSPWNFEVDAWGEDVLHLAHTTKKYVILPRFEAPNFEWRKKFPRYQA
jgi:hypothetical protein